MRYNRSTTATAMLAGLLGCHAANAQTAPGSAIHFSLDQTLSTNYITPRGLVESDSGVTSYTTVGVATSLYSSNTGLAKDLSIHAGALFNLYSRPNASTNGTFRELDWWAGTNLTLQDGIVLGVEYSQFVSPVGAYSSDNNVEFSAVLAPVVITSAVSITPYAKLFYNISGASTTITGKQHDYDVELGVKPAWDLNGYHIPVVLVMPTWFTVGPSSFWGGGGDFGVFTTGVTAKTPLNFIPARYGNWYADAGVQYYHMLNNQLLVAQQDLGLTRQRNVFAASAGIGFGF